MYPGVKQKQDIAILLSCYDNRKALYSTKLSLNIQVNVLAHGALVFLLVQGYKIDFSKCIIRLEDLPSQSCRPV